MANSKTTVLIAGSTGYLGRHLIQAYRRAGFRVRALARRPESLIDLNDQIDEVIFAEAIKPETLENVFDGVDLVVSALGITRQRDGLTYDDVDYQANKNLLDASLRAGVEQFAYIHVLHAEDMPHVAMAAAKARFAKALTTSSTKSTIICPSGFYSDLAEILDMARKGRVYLFGDGQSQMSPIDGADLASVCVDATRRQLPWVDVGGPQSLSQNEIAATAFEALKTKSKITHIPFGLVESLIRIGKKLGWSQQLGPLEFFLAASKLDMTAPNHGEITLAEDFKNRVN